MPISDGRNQARVVIDTNVCLDLFIYRDAAVEPLMRALQSGRVTAVTRTDCRDEWQRVLHYPQFELDAVRRRDACSSYDTWFHEYPPPLQQRNVSIDALPRCGDPDDQKFLELALQAGAGSLVTKDRMLLKLHRRTKRQGLFVIVTPATWIGWLDASGS